MADIRTREGCHEQAVENIERWKANGEVEQQCRAIARLYEADEDEWEQYIPVVVAVEEGRLIACMLERQKPEWRAAFAEYMRNR